jgi:hypothetical protein
VERLPDASRREDAGELPHDILGHGAEESDKHQLILLVPPEKLRVGHLLGIGAGALLHSGRWRGDGAVDVPIEMGRAQCRGSLSLPEEEVVTGQADRDEAGDGLDGDGGVAA